MSNLLSLFLIGIGLFTAAHFLYNIASTISIYLRPSRLHRFAHLSKDGQTPWALVTGASDGIGRALARELAAQGFNIVLHGRNHARLSTVKSELEDAFPRRDFRLLIADATRVACGNCSVLTGGGSHSSSVDEKQAGPVDFEGIRAALDDIYLTALVNNVGGGASNPTYLPLSQEAEKRVTDTVALNALFPVQLTRVLLPSLQRNAPSLVLNASSIADIGVPLLTAYSASKAFLMSATTVQAREMALLGGHDVEFLGIRIGKVTEVSGLHVPSSTSVPSATTMARAALARAGYGSRIVCGYWAHAVMAAAMEMMPRGVLDRTLIGMMREERDTEVRLGKRG